MMRPLQSIKGHIMSSEQKVVIITGASQGIGAGLVRAYRDRNYRVVASSRSIKPSADEDILAVPGEISEPETAERIVREGLERFGGPYLAGAAFTAVDAFFAPVAFRIQTYGLAVDANAASYARRLLALPSMQEWYRDALAETWRDQEHEDEVAATGTVIEDLRRV